MKRCPHCRRSLKQKRKPKAFTLSVSAKTYALIKAAAEVRNWSMRQLVEEATREVR
jgi:hypothetical protein